MRRLSPLTEFKRVVLRLAALSALSLLPMSADAAFTFYARLESVARSMLVDSVETYAAVGMATQSVPYGRHLECNASHATTLDGVVEVRVRIVEGEPREQCERFHSVLVGRLAAGSWTLRVFANDSPTPIHESRYDVVARGVACNANPDENFVHIYFYTPSIATFLGLAADPAWRASLGNLTPGQTTPFIDGFHVEARFDPLADPFPIMEALRRVPGVDFVMLNVYGCLGSCFPDKIEVATEFRRIDRDRFIFVTDPVERDALDSGHIPGWARTGESMRVIVKPGLANAHEHVFHPVYRFWGGSVSHEPSHFFTADQNECAVLRDRKDWNWTFERAGFWAYEWTSTGCPVGVPLRRAYNNGIDGAPAHRYSTRQDVIDAMISRGWVDEGPVMCVQDD